jgi:hypothetical protein
MGSNAAEKSFHNHQNPQRPTFDRLVDATARVRLYCKSYGRHGANTEPYAPPANLTSQARIGAKADVRSGRMLITFK